MSADTIILVQGSSDNVKEQKEAWKSHIVLFSTWKGSEQNYEDGDMVIFNSIPEDRGPSNFWMQQVSTLAGLKKVKEMGYEYCLKIRSDLVPTNSHKFLNCLDKDKLNFLCWHNHEVYPKCSGYLVDYLMFGQIENMIQLWETQNAFCVVPEIILTWNYINNCKCFPKKYFLNYLNEKNDLRWIKRNILLSSYKNIPSFDSHQKFYFTEQEKHLGESYIDFLGLHKG